MIRASVTAPPETAEELRARFVELAPEGFEDADVPGGIELSAYGDAAKRVRAAFPGARLTEVAEGWEDSWRAFHRPVRIGPLWIGPPWERAPDDALAVVIDPGRAFGTGAHATTRLCVELLLAAPRGSVLDVGCGSGVLAIAAAKLGFGPVSAIDNDELAVAATRDNAAANGVEIETRLLDALAESPPPADVVLANLTLATVEALTPRLEAGLVIASGYLVRDKPAAPGWRSAERRRLTGWAADRLTRGD